VPPPNAQADFDNDFYGPVMEALSGAIMDCHRQITDLLARKIGSTSWDRGEIELEPATSKTGAGLERVLPSKTYQGYPRPLERRGV